MNLKEIRYETALTQYLLHKASRMCMPISGTFELTPMCNLACRMCYIRKTRQEVEEHPRPMLTLKQWLKIAEEAKDAGMLYLLLTGGEPFLWPDFWELYERLISMGLLVSINTNGSLLDEAAVERLKAHPPTRVNITLYGASDETYQSLCQAKGMFRRVDRAISRLREAGIMVKLNCSLTPFNAADLAAMNQYAEERNLILEINSYMFPPLRRDPEQIGRNQRFTPEEAAWYHLERYRLQHTGEDYHKFLKNIQAGLVEPPGLDEHCTDPMDGKIQCRAGKAAFWITWDGWMTPCGLMPEPKTDLTVLPFSEAWKELSRQCGLLTLSGVCGKCPDQDMCHACAAMAMAETGSAGGIPKYLCRMVQAMKTLANEELTKIGQ